MDEQMLSKLSNAAVFIAIILGTFLLAFLVNRFFRRLIRKSSESMQSDPTNYQFLRHALVAIVYVVGFGVAASLVPGLKALATSMLAGAGLLAVAVGFASQHALSNIISGAFIIIFKPFRVNDRVKLRELSGVIEDITLRHTVIRDFENRRIIVPNAVISDEIIVNSDFGDERICKIIDIGISYDSDIDLARNIFREEVERHPLVTDNRTPQQLAEGIEKVVIRVTMLAESSVNLRAWAWTHDNADAFALGCDVLEAVKKRFDREGVEIPFPHRTVVYKNHPA